MLGILLYSLGIMYTPGPVNILSLNRGVQARYTLHIPFCCGVGVALFFWFLLIGYAGSALLGRTAMPVISAFGAGFIVYLACKVLASAQLEFKGEGKAYVLSFRDGLVMQLLNPKSFLAVLPVTAVQFPAAGIDGTGIALWSLGLACLGFGAPLLYAYLGSNLSLFVEKPVYFLWFNRAMGIALVWVAVDMVYTHIFQVLWSHQLSAAFP